MLISHIICICSRESFLWGEKRTAEGRYWNLPSLLFTSSSSLTFIKVQSMGIYSFLFKFCTKMVKQKLKKNLDMTRHLVLQLLKTKIKLDIWRGEYGSGISYQEQVVDHWDRKYNNCFIFYFKHTILNQHKHNLWQPARG